MVSLFKLTLRSNATVYYIRALQLGQTFYKLLHVLCLIKSTVFRLPDNLIIKMFNSANYQCFNTL